MEFQKFTRRPYDVNAVQVTPENANEVAEWCGGSVVLGDYKHSKFVIKLPIVKVPGNGVHKGKMIDARIGSWIIEYKGNFRVYREKQILEDFASKDEVLITDQATRILHFEPGDLVKEINPDDGLREGVVKYADQVLVDYGMLGNVLHDSGELVKIERFSEQTLKRLQDEAARQDNDALDTINQLRAEAEKAVMSGNLNDFLTDAFEEQQVIESIGDIKIGTVVRIIDEMNEFFGETGVVEGFVNDNCVAVKMDETHGGKVLDPVNHLVREVQIESETKWVLVHSDTSPQQGWIGWVVRDTPTGELTRVAFRSSTVDARDKCFSYMETELEQISMAGLVVPVYEI